MRWTMMVGTLVAVGLLGTTEVRAQETDLGTAPATSAQQEDGAGSKQLANSTPAYGTYVDGPATVDAQGVPVAKPNPMSDFMDRNRVNDDMPFAQPLVDDPRTDN